MLVIGKRHGIATALRQRVLIALRAVQREGELVVLLPCATAQDLGHLKEAGAVKTRRIGRVLVDEGSLDRLVRLYVSLKRSLLGLEALSGARLVHLIGVALGQTLNHKILVLLEIEGNTAEGIAGNAAGHGVLLGSRQLVALGVLEGDLEGKRGVGRDNTARALHGLADLQAAGLYVIGRLGGLDLALILADTHGRGVGDGLVHGARQHANLHGNGSGSAGSHVAKRPRHGAVVVRAAIARLDEPDACGQRVGEGDGRGVIGVVGVADGVGDLVAHLDLSALIGTRLLGEHAARSLIGFVFRAVLDGNLSLVLDLCSGNRGIALHTDGHAHAAVRVSGTISERPGNGTVAVHAAIGRGDKLHALGQRIGDGHGRGDALAILTLAGYGIVHPVDVVGVGAAGRKDLAVEVLI